MAKEPSPKIVDDEAEYERRFTDLEKTTKNNSDTLAKLAEKLLGEPPAPKPETSPKGAKNEPAPKPSGGAKSFKGFMQEIGLFRRETEA